MTLRDRLRLVVENDRTRAGRVFDRVVLAAIGVSLVSYSLSTLPDLGPAARRALGVVEVVVLVLFVLEYVLRLWVARRPLRFVVSPYGLIDLAAILPAFTPFGANLTALRALRLLKVFRYTHAAERLTAAFRTVRQELLVFLGLAGIVVYLAAVGIYVFEHEAQPDAFRSLFDALWWAVSTLTTVGYGDLYPVTVGGRMFTMVLLVVGLAIVAVPIGLLSSALAAVLREEQASRLPAAEPEAVDVVADGAHPSGVLLGVHEESGPT